MSRNNVPLATASQQRPSTHDSATVAPAPDTIVFDIRSGMPLTRAAARSMSVTSLRTALGKAVESLPGRGGAPQAGSGTTASPALDSLEVVWLLAKLDRLFDKPLVDLTKVRAPHWSTLDAVARSGSLVDRARS